MKIQDFQVIKCSSHVHIPFSSQWSEDGFIAMATEKGVYVTGGQCKSKWILSIAISILCLLALVLPQANATDITQNVFGGERDVQPAAFGDFDSDEYPDLFVIRNNSKTVEILLGREDVEPLLRTVPGLKCSFKESVTSVVPGDFDGDALMDVLVTLKTKKSCKGGDEVNTVRILWGGRTLNCSDGDFVYASTCGQPLAMDYNEDMVIDLFGSSESGERTFWIFSKENQKYHLPLNITMNEPNRMDLPHLRIPHSHAFIDLNGDMAADLFVTAEDEYEIWYKNPDQKEGFASKPKIVRLPTVNNKKVAKVGQSLMLDIELKGKIDHLVPVCLTEDCKESKIFVYSSGNWIDLKVPFHDKTSNAWGFVPPKRNSLYLKAITLRGGDFNMDGFPDLLATLQCNGMMRNFILTNVQCKSDCDRFGRTFEVDWDTLKDMNNETVVAVFYDFMQDGILDVVFVREKGGTPNASAFKNSLDYDANFLKVMVLTGIKDKKPEAIHGPLGRKNRTFGTNLPGPVIFYSSTDQDDRPRAAKAGQLPQSAYFSLHLPYTLFGLGRTANFVDQLIVGISGFNRTWTQLIPNSQMFVIPIPLEKPLKWTARLFVTPSKLILKSFIALLSICLVISIIIFILYWKERKEDRHERMQEVDRFHYDGM